MNWIQKMSAKYIDPSKRPCGECRRKIRPHSVEDGTKIGHCGCSVWVFNNGDWNWVNLINNNDYIEEDEEETPDPIRTIVDHLAKNPQQAEALKQAGARLFGSVINKFKAK